ncbi:MAG: hypothetical protein Q8S33_05530 [Myxococcales bacterium]|nr:hypothetical protein [Myxococcales bacterium]
MAAIKLDTVRSGVRLLSGLMKAADNREDYNLSKANGDKRLSPFELKEFKDAYGDGASLDKAMTAIHKYAQAKFGVKNPSTTQLNQALADAMKFTARADIDKSKDLSPTERKSLAKTWDSVIQFAKDYQGTSVRDIVSPRGAP